MVSPSACRCVVVGVYVCVYVCVYICVCVCVRLLVRVFEKRSDAMEMTCNEIIMSLTWLFRLGVGAQEEAHGEGAHGEGAWHVG